MTQREAIRNILSDATDLDVVYDEPMSRHASLKLGGKAAALVAPHNEAALIRVVGILRKNGIAFLPVGNLTNLLVLDGGYPGVLVWMRTLVAVTASEVNGVFEISAQAGAPLARVTALAASRELAGFECLAGIPGSVGGAIRMNAGAFGTDMQAITTCVELLDADGTIKTLTRTEIPFSYRSCGLPADVLITGARFALQKGDAAAIRAKMAEIMKWRQEKHPLRYPNAGSVFKNPPDLPAGRLIEELGLKGVRHGDAQISKQHANFIINKGRATAADVMALIHLVQQKAKEEKGVSLEPEWAIIGEGI